MCWDEVCWSNSYYSGVCIVFWFYGTGVECQSSRDILNPKCFKIFYSSYNNVVCLIGDFDWFVCVLMTFFGGGFCFSEIIFGIISI